MAVSRVLQKTAAHVLMALPLLGLMYLALTQQLGPDPAEHLMKELGFYGACILWLTLAITPLKKLTGIASFMAYRRLLGLWSFFYLTLHLLVFVVLWAGLNVAVLLEEVSQRPYIIVGTIAWLLLVPLTITSTRKARRSMGRRWQSLHRLVYIIAVLGLVHITWIAKLDFTQPALFGAVLLVLFGLRIKFKKNRQSAESLSTLP
ncbi:MAG: sulfoxide reductase heme-binding subunit YedZ [Pseudomonadales bacterium]|nr:sulfoxide reductase heme-binding subunit YedZ [Pseudomonadales bacterium]